MPHSKAQLSSPPREEARAGPQRASRHAQPRLRLTPRGPARQAASVLLAPRSPQQLLV